MPKFALLVRATATSESGTFKDPKIFEDMSVYNASLVEAGALVAGDGFLPSLNGARVHYSSSPGTEPTVTNGPFDVASLVSGYWIIKATDLDEAVAWAKKVPFKSEDAVVEVRKVAGPEDFGDAMTEEVKEKNEALRKRLDEQT